MRPLLLVDFDDSFTHNIAEILFRVKIDFKIINYSKVNLDYIKAEGFGCVLWGPGPGHPDEYPITLELIKQLFFKDIFQMGICLGHQLIFKGLGFKIIEAPVKKHGQSSLFKIPSWDFFIKDDWEKKVDVQFYSSLAVQSSPSREEIKSVIDSGLVQSGYGDNFLSYQFHPESIGTSCPEAFFRGLKEKLI